MRAYNETHEASCSRSVTGQRKTLGGKRYRPTSTDMSSDLASVAVIDRRRKYAIRPTQNAWAVVLSWLLAIVGCGIVGIHTFEVNYIR